MEEIKKIITVMVYGECNEITCTLDSKEYNKVLDFLVSLLRDKAEDIAKSDMVAKFNLEYGQWDGIVK